MITDKERYIVDGKEISVHRPEYRTYVAGEWETEQLTSDTGIAIGYTENNGTPCSRTITESELLSGAVITGQAGYGKTTLFVNIIQQLMERNRGLCFVTTHENAALDVLRRVPDSRRKDVVWVDPTDENGSVSFNLLNLPSDADDSTVTAVVQSVLEMVRDDELHTEQRELLSTIVESAVLSPNSYTLVDVQEALTSLHSDEVSQQDLALDDRVQRTSELVSDNALERLSKELELWCQMDTNAHFVAGEENAASLPKLVSDDSIIVVNLCGIQHPESNRRAIEATMRQLHIASRKRADRGAGQNPYYICLDNYTHFEQSEVSTVELMEQGQEIDMGILVNTKYIEQSETASAAVEQAENVISFNPGTVDEATAIAPYHGSNLESEPEEFIDKRMYTAIHTRCADESVNTVNIFPKRSPIHLDEDILEHGRTQGKLE